MPLRANNKHVRLDIPEKKRYQNFNTVELNARYIAGTNKNCSFFNVENQWVYDILKWGIFQRLKGVGKILLRYTHQSDNKAIYHSTF